MALDRERVSCFAVRTRRVRRLLRVWRQVTDVAHGTRSLERRFGAAGIRTERTRCPAAFEHRDRVGHRRDHRRRHVNTQSKVPHLGGVLFLIMSFLSCPHPAFFSFFHPAFIPLWPMQLNT